MYNRYINEPAQSPVVNNVDYLQVMDAPSSSEKKDESTGFLSSLLSSIKIPHLELDDILLLVIIYLLLRESDDNDMIIILAFLFFSGFFDKE